MIRQVGYERLGIFTTDTNVEDVIKLMFDSPIAIEEKTSQLNCASVGINLLGVTQMPQQ
jgi:hypothetical protein